MDLSAIFLGTGGSVPSARRSTASVMLVRGGRRLMFDCGEGTQRQLQRSLGLTQVDEIFLTHFHADHILGLPGLLKTYDLTAREEPLTIYGPRGLRDLFKTLGPPDRPHRLQHRPDRNRPRRSGAPRRCRGPGLRGRAQRAGQRLRADRGGAPGALRPGGGEAARRRRRARLRGAAEGGGGGRERRAGAPAGRDGRGARRVASSRSPATPLPVTRPWRPRPTPTC